MKYRLNNNDIAFIAEMRSEGVCWKVLGLIFGRDHDDLSSAFYTKMKSG